MLLVILFRLFISLFKMESSLVCQKKVWYQNNSFAVDHFDFK